MVEATAPLRETPALAVEDLETAGVDTPRLDAEVMLAAVLGTDRAALHADPQRMIELDAAERFDEMLRRRVRREPVAQILGRAHFRQLELTVDHRVLVLRPGGMLAMEVGQGQSRAVEALFERSGMRLLETQRDLARIPRVVRGRR